MAAKPRVIVIGGGPGGANIAKTAALTAVADVTLIDTKEYYEAVPSTLRAFTEPAWIERCTWKHEAYLSKVGAKFLLGSVVRVEEKAVHLADGSTVPFDYVVIATGSSVAATNKLPTSQDTTLQARAAWFRAEAERLAAAKSVLIVGGGSVGVEFAGEILTDMPGKKVTIVQSGAKLFSGGTPAVPDSYADGAAKWLTSKGATVIFNDRVDTQGARGSTPGATYKTSKGVSIQADYVFQSIGLQPNTGFYDPAKLNNARRIVVDQFLQVRGAKGHFAVGDCAATEDATYAYAAMQQGQLTAKNIVAAIKGKKMAAHKKGPTVQLLSLGRRDGRCLMPFGECSSCCAVSIKSKDLALGMSRDMFGIK